MSWEIIRDYKSSTRSQSKRELKQKKVKSRRKSKAKKDQSIEFEDLVAIKVQKTKQRIRSLKITSKNSSWFLKVIMSIMIIRLSLHLFSHRKSLL